MKSEAEIDIGEFVVSYLPQKLSSPLLQITPKNIKNIDTVAKRKMTSVYPIAIW